MNKLYKFTDILEGNDEMNVSTIKIKLTIDCKILRSYDYIAHVTCYFVNAYYNSLVDKTGEINNSHHLRETLSSQK